LFTPTCLCRSQSSGGSMIDCSVTGRGSCVYHISHYNIYVYIAFCIGCAPFPQCLGRLSLPPYVGWQNEHQLLG